MVYVLYEFLTMDTIIITIINNYRYRQWQY